MKYDTGTIKRIVSCRDLLALNGVEVNRKNKARCVFHDDKHASMHIYADGGFKCFSCNAHGDVIDLACQLYSVSFHDACRILAEQNGIPPSQDESFRQRIDEQRRHRKEQADRVERLRDAYFDAVRQFRDAEAERDLLAPRRQDEVPGALFFAALDRCNQAADAMTRAEWALHDAEGKNY